MSKQQDSLSRFTEFYSLLSQQDLSRVARKARVEIEDVRQEAQLLCWSMATGQSTFNAAKGSPKQYLMGCLWGFAEHEHFHAHQAANEVTELIASQIKDEAPSPLECLINEEEIEAGQYLPGTNAFTTHMSLEEMLWFSGLSFALISEFTGMGKTTLFKRISGKFQSKTLK